MFQINGETWFIKFVDPDSFIFKMTNNEYTIVLKETETNDFFASSGLFNIEET